MQRVVQTVTLNLYWHFILSIVAHLDDWLLFTSVKHCSLCHKTAVRLHSSAYNTILSEATCSAHLGALSTSSELATYCWICQPAHVDHELAIFYNFYTLCMQSILDQLTAGSVSLHTWTMNWPYFITSTLYACNPYWTNLLLDLSACTPGP